MYEESRTGGTAWKQGGVFFIKKRLLLARVTASDIVTSVTVSEGEDPQEGERKERKRR